MGLCGANSSSLFSENAISAPVDAVIIAVFDIILVTISIFLNIVVILAVVRNKRLHTVANLFIASLAASNLILAIITDVKLTIVLLSCYKLVLYNISDCLYLYFYSFSMTCGVYSHFLIASERWLYIVRPFLHQRVVTLKSTVYGVIFSWIIALLGGVNIISSPCTETFYDINARISYCLVTSVLYFMLSTFMFLIYGHITVITRNQTRAIQKTVIINPENSRREIDVMISNVKSTWKQVRMLVTVFGVYFSLMSPYIITNIYVFAKENNLKFYFSNFGMAVALIFHAQYGVNFLTYCLQDRDFRHVLQQYFLKSQATGLHRRVQPLPTVT